MHVTATASISLRMMLKNDSDAVLITLVLLGRIIFLPTNSLSDLALCTAKSTKGADASVQ